LLPFFLLQVDYFFDFCKDEMPEGSEERERGEREKERKQAREREQEQERERKRESERVKSYVLSVVYAVSSLSKASYALYLRPNC
jgi:hypothetical protein